MYIPLYNKSNYTLLSSLLKIDDIIKYAKDSNLQSIALTDTNMYGVMEFIKKCKNNNIKPIIGLDILLNDFNVVVYAKDYEGYKSLIKLSTIQNERLVELDDLKKYNKSVISILPFKYMEKYKDLSKIYNELYLGYANKKEEKEALILTKNVVFFRESLYLNKNDVEILPYLYRIRDSKTISDEIDYEVFDHELKINDVLELSDNTGLINSIKISDSCNLEFPKATNLLPIYECDDPAKYLFELCKAGLTKRLGGNIPDNYKKRLSYELKIINDMGFPNYFLVVYDFIKFDKSFNLYD